MRLREIEIHSFRSLYAAELSLKPLTLIIGLNGSGKSNLFKALRFLHVGVAGDIKDWRSYEAQAEDLLWYGKDVDGLRPTTFSLATGFSEPAVDYSAAFSANGSIRVGRETLATPTDEVFFQRIEDRISVATPAEAQLFFRSPHTLALRDLGPSFEALQPRAVYQHIAGWRFFEVDARLAREGSFIPPDATEVPPLEPDAANLSAFLYALQRLRPDDFAAVLEAVRRSIELPQGLLVEHDADRGGRQARYRFIEAPFGEERLVPPDSMSDGTIRLLAPTWPCFSRTVRRPWPAWRSLTEDSTRASWSTWRTRCGRRPPTVRSW